MSTVVIGGKYLHYKNKEYKVLATAIHSETLEELVIYECLYENPQGQIWARPKSLFFEEVKVGRYQGPRFRLIEEY